MICATGNGMRSKNAWKKLGFKVRKGERPREQLYTWKFRRKYGVYDETQIEQIAIRLEIPPREIGLLPALRVVNRYAKRARDCARNSYEAGAHAFASIWKTRKDEAYHLKDQALHYAIAENKLSLVGHHLFGDHWAEVWEGEGYRFHRPCPLPVPAPENVEDLGEEIGAKEKDRNEARLKDAIHTLRVFLKDKPEVAVYSLPRHDSSRRLVTCYACGMLGHIARDCPDQEWDDDELFDEN